jgi:hypothetical protein
MSDYTKSTNFAAKDALASGNAAKIVKGTEIDTEFNNIAIAIATKADIGSGGGGTGTGDVVGPSAATDNAIARFDTTTGKLLQNSVGILSNAGVLTGVTLAATAITSGALASGVTIAATSVSSGTLADARLSSNVSLLNTAQTVTAEKTFTGTVGIGTTNPSAVWNLYCQNATTNPGAVFFNNSTSGYAQLNMVGTGVTQLMLFQKSSTSAATGTTTDVGSITTTGTSTGYNTSSDYRLKTNVTPITGAIARVKNLAPVRFNWISDLAAPAVDGFIAHEVSAVVPEAINGVKDDVYADGKIKPQGIDQAKLVPLLVAALQEAIARIEALEAA